MPSSAFRTVLIWAFTTTLITYGVIPLVYRYCPALQRHLVFLTFVNYPRAIDFSNPESEGLPGTRNFYLDTEDNVKVGVWHILPESLLTSIPMETTEKDAWFENSLGDHRPVILYLHGNTASRAVAHRIELYNVLRKMDYHVVAFDYRGKMLAYYHTVLLSNLFYLKKIGTNSHFHGRHKGNIE
ncbi:lysophosphatidylserine lipase ABHD12-like [Palaemon carinicauda]|uniref:lysophosphatidylserine lipase ABHD12-like n=1 Tax=Palaemon carinicauda TaxID=392227 RepID=UPI0035B5A547